MITACASQAVLATYFPDGRWARGSFASSARDLLDDRMVAVPGVGLDHGQGRVGDKRVMPVCGEQLALPGADGWIESFHAAHDESAGQMLFLPAGSEDGDLGFSDLGVRCSWSS